MPDFSSIENLKKAEEQLREPTSFQEPSSNPDPSSAPNWTFSQNWKKEILNEKQKLEKVYKEIQDWQRKIQERLKLIKEIEEQGAKINEGLHKFQQKIVLIKKENKATLFQINDSSLRESLSDQDDETINK